MADSKPEPQPAAAAPNTATNATSAAAPKPNAAKAAAAEGNPVFRMMGLPNIKPKLPSRNWMIFLGVTSTFAGLVYYDKRETARIQKHYCDMVSPLASVPLPPTVMPRKMTVYLQASPADGLRNAREHFYNYMKPVLVAAAADWDVVEGRKEGDLRFGTAEKIRSARRRAGEGEPQEDEKVRFSVLEMRDKVGTTEEEGNGDIVVGRHAWKEYLRGLHEGWLGPVAAPAPPAAVAATAFETEESRQHVDGSPSLGDAAVTAAANIAASPSSDTQPSASPSSPTSTDNDDNASPTANTTTTTETPAKEEEPAAAAKQKPSKPLPYISTSDYSTSTPSPLLPQTLGPAIPIPFPHILGFWNFPIRLYRFLHRRHLAEQVCSATAAAVLSQTRDFRPEDDLAVLETEESEWHKSVRKAERVEGEERVWLDDVVTDERIVSRLRVFEFERTSKGE